MGRTLRRFEIDVEHTLRELNERDRRLHEETHLPIVEQLAATPEGRRKLAAIVFQWLDHKHVPAPDTPVAAPHPGEARGSAEPEHAEPERRADPEPRAEPRRDAEPERHPDPDDDTGGRPQASARDDGEGRPAGAEGDGDGEDRPRRRRRRRRRPRQASAGGSD